VGSRPRVSNPKPIGPDPVSASPLAHQPASLAAFNRLYGTLWSRGVVDQATKEVARIRNARVIDCRLCRSLRFAGARAAGLTEERVDLITDGYEASDLSPAHKAVLRLTDHFLRAPGPPPEPLRAELARHFTPAQIVELVAGLALFFGFSKIAVSLGGLPENIPVMEVPTPDA
jgi:AhpD family alkylhydroperoxidase